MGQAKQSVFSLIHKCQIFIYHFSSKFYASPRLKYFTEMQGHSQSNHFLIVGLGNYGFDKTRHSVGMKAVDELANKLNLNWDTYDGSICSTKLDHTRLTLFKPKALMNVNGRSVGRIVHQLSIKPSNIYLVHDELDRIPGTFHLKEGGSAGGHKGVLSCMETLGSKDMHRLRIGIGRPTSKALVVPYVLSSFSKEETHAIDTAVQLGLQSLLHHIKQRSPQPRLVKSAAAVRSADTIKTGQVSVPDSQSADLKAEPFGSLDEDSNSKPVLGAERNPQVNDKDLSPER